MRILTAGESHGEGIVALIEGFPKGVPVDLGLLQEHLSRRMSGWGRGKRMSIESDEVRIISGLRNRITLGSPIAIVVRNKDVRVFAGKKDSLQALNVPRPAHADLAGALKYHDPDMRNILERASARETVARVAAGSLCLQLLSQFGVAVASFTVSVGPVASGTKPGPVASIRSAVRRSQLNCIDMAAEKKMIEEIEACRREGDSLGGVIEIRAEGVCPGLGTCMHFDRRLDAKLAYYLMSIPAVKGVEVGLGFEYARKRGSLAHDVIAYTASKGFTHKTNNSGGIEGGMSTGETIVLRYAMKPIATLMQPLDSVNIRTKKKQKAPSVRSDTCAVAACGVIGESMTAIALTESFLEKFGSDTLSRMQEQYQTYVRSLKQPF